MLKRMIAVANQKGGVGKTTTAVNLSAALALAGKKVLFVDIDPQGNGTSGLGVGAADIRRTIYNVFVAGEACQDVIVPTPIAGIDLIPSEPDLFGVDVELMAREGREFILQKALGQVAHLYDYVIMDCPPSITLLTVNALTAADSVLVPVQCQYYALEGLSQLLKTVELFREGLNPRLEIEGFLLTMYEEGSTLAHNVAQEVREHFPDKVFRTVVLRDPALSEAPGFGKPVTHYQLRSQGAENYIELADEILEQRERCLVGSGA